MIESLILASVLIMLRVVAFVTFMPPLNGQGMPNTVKIGLSAAITLLLVTQHAYDGAVNIYSASTGQGYWLFLFLMAARETAFGAGLAWLMGLAMVPLRIAGAWVAQEMGLTLGGIFSPMDAQPSNPISQALEAVGVLLFFVMNLHHVLFAAVGNTFRFRPVGAAWVMPDWHTVVYTVSTAINQGFMIIAPLGILMFVTLIMLLITIRAVPQFNFMSYGMTVRLAAGMGGIVLFYPEIFGAVQSILQGVGTGAIF